MFKAGFVGIIGRPNVGKSTLLNAITGERIAIATAKPQTTRNRITGIKNVPAGQLVFVDTPGIHRPLTPLNKAMVEAAKDVFGSVDVLLLLLDAPAGLTADDREILASLAAASRPVVLGINKIDLIDKPKLLPLLDACRQAYDFAAMIPLSALKENGLDVLEAALLDLLPEGQALFPEDLFTDVSERFIAAETIREKILLLTHKEIPYASAVTVDAFKEDEARNLIRIAATITVEKDSQKAILIGKRGEMLKKIGSSARHDLEKFFAARIFLELFVRVRKDWTSNESILRDLGYKTR